MKLQDILRAATRRPLLLTLSAVALIAVVVLALTLRISPHVTVKLELTPAAHAQLVRSRLPICLDLTLAGDGGDTVGLRGERRCLFDAGEVVFRGHPYLKRGETQLVIRTAGYEGTSQAHAYRCAEVVHPVGGASEIKLTASCDLL
ncbi:hypothetical protein [Caulobacter mirabilis]|uniref:hypothetical protein n=1 Tax=Caulobacter mirabilis TaxID=69666 RepID=UPI0012375890|nr:hypothetical protein [Caulobacter mirabilis]